MTSRGPRRRKRFGQHFLAAGWARKVVQAIRPEPGDVFLEIGPGAGALTLPLAETGAPLLAIEIDRDLAAGLADRVPPNVTVMTGDFLTTDATRFLAGLRPQRPAELQPPARNSPRFRIVGNLPYNVTSPILKRLVDLYREQHLLLDATVMVQREVADRLLAAPGSKDYGASTILLGRHADIARLLDLPPGAFSPAPKVRSTVVRLTFRPPLVPVSDEPAFERLTKALFSQRRKTLLNALRLYDPLGPAALTAVDLDPRRRPETLQPGEIARLADAIAAGKRRPVL